MRGYDPQVFPQLGMYELVEDANDWQDNVDENGIAERENVQ